MSNTKIIVANRQTQTSTVHNGQGTKAPNSSKDSSEDRDSVTIIQENSSGDNKFTIWQSCKKLLKGVFSPLTVFFQHPLVAVGALIAGVTACSLAPAFMPIIGIGFGAYSVYQLVRGIQNVTERYKAGDYDGAENAFEDIGAGISGVLMGFLGIRASAAVAAETKATHVAIQAGKTTEEVIEAGSIAASQVKDMTFLQALSENCSVVTTSEGRSTLFAQLKPSAIKQRIDYIRNYVKNPLGQAKLKRIDEESDFVLSLEGQRRAKLTKADIEAEAKQVLTEALDDAAIPCDIHPKFKVDDELRFLSKEEIECLTQKEVVRRKYSATGRYENCRDSELPRVQIFEAGEIPQQFTNEQIIEKAKCAVTKVYDEMGVPQDKRSLEHLYIGDRDYIGANFKSSEYQVNYHANSFRKGVFTKEEALAHEVEHVRHTILRTKLSDAERAAIVEDEIIHGIIHGETEEIILRCNFIGGPTMMKPPKMSLKMKQKIIDLLKDTCFRDSKKYREAFYDKHMDSVRDRINSTSNTAHNNLSSELKILEARVEAIVNANPDFVQRYSGNRTEAVKNLLEYIEAQSNRFSLFSNLEIRDTSIIARIRQTSLTAAEREEAIESLKGLIPTQEGNGRNQKLIKLFHDEEAFNQYQFSSEEIMARNSAAKFETKKIKAKMAELKQREQLTPDKEREMISRLDELDFEINRNNTGEQFYRAYTRHINDPDNPEFLAEFKRLEKEYQISQKKIEDKLEKFRKKSEYKHIRLSFPLHNAVRVRGWDDSKSKKAEEKSSLPTTVSFLKPALVKVSLA